VETQPKTLQGHEPQPAPDYEQIMLRSYRALLRLFRSAPPADKAQIRKAFEVARDAHHHMRRKSGEPYILHPLAVARIVAGEMGLLDATSIMCALLHDVVEDTSVTLDEIRLRFGSTVAEIVNGLTKISSANLADSVVSEQAENMRKILLTMSNDIRVILVKLADRLHNMRTLGAMRQEKMLKIASETLYIYAPLAHRLGLYEIKTELEDLAFMHSQPAKYTELAEKLRHSREEAQAYIDRFIRGIKLALRSSGLHFTVHSRFKSIYSIHAKMERKGLPFEEIYDQYAVRIILETREGYERRDCWTVYSIVSGLFPPNPKRLRDWITVPKENGYESLHTTLKGPDGKWVEVQIRTARMDEIAERGVAAHWRYKENGAVQDDFLTEWIARIRDILKNPDVDAQEAVWEFKQNLLPDNVFVFTPKGEMIRLPSGASVIDFAYKIHSHVGDTAIGAKVNNQVMPLSTVLRPGDLVEILTSRIGRPRESWLRMAKTPRALDRIRTYLKKERQEIIDQGERTFWWKAARYNITEASDPKIREILAWLMLPDLESLYYAIGAHQVDEERLSSFIEFKQAGKQLDPERIEQWEQQQRYLNARLKEAGLEPDALVLGADRMPESIVAASCCNPVRGDEILGFEQDGKIRIHRIGCQEAIRLMSQYGNRIVRVRWTDQPIAADASEEEKKFAFLTGIKVVGYDKKGMLSDLVRVISKRMKLNIRKVTIESRDGLFDGLFDVYVRDAEELESLLERLRNVQNVSMVSRYDSSVEQWG
jgi:GTP pyrophosphokinase